MGDYQKELETITKWIYDTTGVKGLKLDNDRTRQGRPFILYEIPWRGRDRNITRYKYVNEVRQYAKLFVRSAMEALEIQEKLLKDIEDKDNILEIKDSQGNTIGLLKEVNINFPDSQGLEVNFNIQYEVTYSRPKPDEPPAADFVGNRISVEKDRGEVDDH